MVGLKSRVAALDRRFAPPPGVASCWIYYNARKDGILLRDEECSCTMLQVRGPAPEPIPAGAHLYGLRRGAPYPPPTPPSWCGRPDRPEILSVEAVEAVRDLIEDSLPWALAAHARRAEVLVAIA